MNTNKGHILLTASQCRTIDRIGASHRDGHAENYDGVRTSMMTSNSCSCSMLASPVDITEYLLLRRVNVWGLSCKLACNASDYLKYIGVKIELDLKSAQE